MVNVQGEAMNRFSFATAILLLSAAPLAAPAQQQSDQSQLATLEGCLSADVDAFFLTDTKGTTHALGGNTNQLTARVGHQVRLSGTTVPGDAEAIPGGVHQAVFEVEKVRSLSTSCK
jgi:hypothetical protein